MLVVLLPVALTTAVALIVYAGDSTTFNAMGVTQASQAASDMVGPWIFGAALAITPLGMWAGIWAGRPLVRGLVRALLTPRMAGALGFLWTAEGREPPRARRA
jgi:hypothetical protein